MALRRRGKKDRVADPRPGVVLGQRVTPDPDTDLALDASNGVAKVRGHWVRVEKVSDKEFEAWKVRRQEELTRIKVVGAGLRIDSKAAGAGPDGAMGEPESDKVREDVRTLWVLYDEQG